MNSIRGAGGGGRCYSWFNMIVIIGWQISLQWQLCYNDFIQDWISLFYIIGRNNQACFWWTYTHVCTRTLLVHSFTYHSIKSTLEGNVQQIIWTHYYFIHSITLPDCWANECHAPFHSGSLSRNYSAALLAICCPWMLCFSSSLFIINANCEFPSPDLQWEKHLALWGHFINNKLCCVYTVWWKKFREIQPHHLAH